MKNKKNTSPIPNTACLVAVWAGMLFCVLIWATGADAQDAYDRAARALEPDARPFAAFFKDLHDLESGERRDPVVILQIGDSHTAGDQFSGRLRARFQERFGDAGRGMLAPGVPFKDYNPTQVKAAMSEGWAVSNSLREAEGVYGLTGFRVSSSTKGAEMSLRSLSPNGFDAFGVEFVAQPGGGTFLVWVDDTVAMAVSTHDDKVRARSLTMTDPWPGRRSIGIQAQGDGPVDLLSWTIDGDRPGVIYESFGVIGATVELSARWDEEAVKRELNLRKPSLLVIEYGGNEGFNDQLTAPQYERIFRDRTTFFRRALPKTPILVIGPADGVRLPSYCGPAKDCRPLTPRERERYTDLLSKKDRTLCRYHPPPNLSMVRETQKTVAKSEGFAFWDWSRVMDGDCGIFEWVHRDPPLAHKDHLHLRAAGAEISADALFQSIMDQYDLFSAQIAANP